MIEYFKTLSPEQVWFILIFCSVALSSVLILALKLLYSSISERGITTSFFTIPPKNKPASPLATDVWKIKIPDPENPKKTLDEIGFVRDEVIFKFFGTKWNSGTPETQMAYSAFLDEWHPPEYLNEDEKHQAECYVFLKDCKIQTKLTTYIKENSNRWRHVYIICTRNQMSNDELNSLDNALIEKDGGKPLNITLRPVSTLPRTVA